MSNRKVKIRAWAEGDMGHVKAIIFHPMETGLRKDKKTGKPIPAHYITEVNCTLNGQTVMNCLWGPGVSKNPFLAFNFKGAKNGDEFAMNWTDNTGESGSDSVKIK